MIDAGQQQRDFLRAEVAGTTIGDGVGELRLPPLAENVEQSVESVKRGYGALKAIGLREAAPHGGESSIAEDAGEEEELTAKG